MLLMAAALVLRPGPAAERGVRPSLLFTYIPVSSLVDGSTAVRSFHLTTISPVAP